MYWFIILINRLIPGILWSYEYINQTMKLPKKPNDFSLGCSQNNHTKVRNWRMVSRRAAADTCSNDRTDGTTLRRDLFTWTWQRAAKCCANINRTVQHRSYQSQSLSTGSSTHLRTSHLRSLTPTSTLSSFTVFQMDCFQNVVCLYIFLAFLPKKNDQTITTS
jgi:hypothetical protein